MSDVGYKLTSCLFLICLSIATLCIQIRYLYGEATTHSLPNFFLLGKQNKYGILNLVLLSKCCRRNLQGVEAVRSMGKEGLLSSS